MRIELLETNISNRRQYDISDIVKDPITWTTSLSSQPGKLQFDMLNDSNVYLGSGDEIELRVDGKKVFKGKVFSRRRGLEDVWSVTAYDSTFYLRNEDTLLFNANTLGDRFKHICETQRLPYKILDRPSYKCSAVVEDKHTYYSMLEDALEETRKSSGQRFGFWDNFGTMELFNLNRQITNLVIGDESLMTNYSFEVSIEDAANSVKVLREDKDKGKREIHTASHSGNISKWGKLQIVDTISDADLNSAQLKQRADVLLKEKNKEAQTISVEALGDLSLRAGNSFTWRNSDVTKDSVGNDSLALITHCVHQIGTKPKMTLEVEVVA